MVVITVDHGEVFTVQLNKVKYSTSSLSICTFNASMLLAD